MSQIFSTGVRYIKNKNKQTKKGQKPSDTMTKKDKNSICPGRKCFVDVNIKFYSLFNIAHFFREKKCDRHCIWITVWIKVLQSENHKKTVK